jgi:phosphoribosylformylglycinamidine synthase subunit PurL
VTRRVRGGFDADGAHIYLLGDTHAEFGGSEWAHVVHGHLGGRPPAVDLDAERLLADILINSSRDGLIDSAHDLSDGGLAQALVESCLRHARGARIIPPENVDPAVFLFAESAARAIVTVPRSEEIRFTDMCTARGQAHRRIGVVDAQSGTLEIQGRFTVTLDTLHQAARATLPALYG